MKTLIGLTEAGEQEWLTNEDARSSYGQPVLLIGKTAYGPADREWNALRGGWFDPCIHVTNLLARPIVSPEARILGERFLALASRPAS